MHAGELYQYNPYVTIYLLAETHVNQILLDDGLDRGSQQVLMKGDEPTSPSIFTVYSQLAALRRVSPDILLPARSHTRPEGRPHRHIVHLQSCVRAVVDLDIDTRIGIARLKRR